MVKTGKMHQTSWLLFNQPTFLVLLHQN